MSEIIIPNQHDTQCRKCTQFFFKGSISGMTSFCVTDGESHDWFSPTAELTAERDKYRDACERLIEHYGNQQRWALVPVPEFDCSKYLRYEYFENHGYEIARQVKAEIDTPDK